jgi:hypothetical protein
MQQRRSSAFSNIHTSLSSEKNKTEACFLNTLEDKAQEILHMPVPTFV